jgi:transcriptional regulator with XRE-family HTH domain
MAYSRLRDGKSQVVATGQGPVVQSALLRGALVRLRRERELTQQQVATSLDWSASKLIRIEGGHSSVTRVDLSALLDTYGVTSEAERTRLLTLNQGARERAWWDDYRADLPSEYLTYVGYEAGASFVRIFQNALVPGLLQTRAYAQVVTGIIMDERAEISVPVNLRLRRQAELVKRTPPPYQYYVLDEAVIRRHVGISSDPGIMPAQLREIAARAGGEATTIRVIPFRAGAHSGLTSPFTLLAFDGGLPDILYLDAARNMISLYIGEDARVSEYADAFERLLDDALSAEESVEFIMAVAEEMS